MVSLLSSSVSTPIEGSKTELRLNELGNVQTAQKPFVQLILSSGCSRVRLHCSVPTCCPSSETCLDLFDLHESRSRCLLFVHSVLEALRGSGLSASHSVAPSNSPYCVVCVVPAGSGASKVSAMKDRAINGLAPAQLIKRDTVLLADLEVGPAVIFT